MGNASGQAWGPVLGQSVYQSQSPVSTGLQVEFINPIFEFSRAMRRLGLDDAEYALLIAINIFSADRPNVQEPSRVEALQQPYVDALLSYTRIKRPQVPEPGPSQGNLDLCRVSFLRPWLTPAAEL